MIYAIQKLVKTIKGIRLIPTIITCMMLALYGGYLYYLIGCDIGNRNVNITLLVITAISFILQILICKRIIKGSTSRNLKRLCRVAKILTHIFALGVAIYTSSADASIFSFLMLPVWFAQLFVEIIAAIIERRIKKKFNIKDIGLFLLDPLHIGRDVITLINNIKGKKAKKSQTKEAKARL